MDTTNIISIATTGINLISIICYTIILLIKNKKSTKNIVENIIRTIPTYISHAKNIANTDNKNIIANIVLTEIKNDFEKEINKKSENKIKKIIEEELD